MSLYQLNGVKQVFEGRTVLDIEHLEIKEAGSYALLGPNGCGKTTLLNILAFLRAPAAGKTLFRNRPVDWSENKLRALRKQVVLVDQHPIMFTTSVIKNVEYGLKMRGVKAVERRNIARECLELVGMSDFAPRPAHLLSGGETQRLAIARAMACRPEVMLFDEPTSGVDLENQAAIESIIRDIRTEKGVTVVFSTHKLMEAERLGDNMIFMFEGRLSGPGGENLLSGTVVRRGKKCVCIVGESLELEAAAKHAGPCRVFIRSEKIKIFSLKQAGNVSSSTLVPGTVLQMTAIGGHIKVLVDAGVFLRAILTRQEVIDSGIVAGDEIRVEFAPGAVHIEP